MSKNHAMRRKKERGQALAEFALITPLLVILIFGFVDTARLYHSWVTVQGAAREAARYGVTGREDCPISSDDRVSCIEYHAEQRAQQLADIDTGMTVTVRSWDYPDYPNPPNEGDPGQQCDALEVQVEYDYTPSTPLADLFLGDVHLTARERLVNEPFGVCGS